jgi:hypothetical protein
MFNNHLPLLRSDSISENESVEHYESSAESEFDKRSDGSGLDVLHHEADRNSDSSSSESTDDEVDERSNDSHRRSPHQEGDRKSDGSDRELLDDENYKGIFGKLNLIDRPPTPIKSRKVAKEQPRDRPPPKLISILRPPRVYPEASSDATLLRRHNGSRDGSPQRDGSQRNDSPLRERQTVVAFNDVPQLVPHLKIKSTSLPAPLLKRVDKSATTRRVMIETQNDVDILRRRYNHDRSLFVGAAQELIEATSQFATLIDGVPIDSRLKSIFNDSWTRFKLQASELVAQDRYLKETDESLIKMEAMALGINTDLLERELKLFESYDQFDVPAGQKLVEHYDDDDAGTVSAQSASSWEDPTVKDYYDKIGEVSLTMDHLHNLDTDHLSKLYSWESARQRGIQVTGTQLDDIFSEYFSERRDLMTQYMRGRHETVIFYELCKDMQLDVEPPNLPPEDFTTLDSSLRRTAWDMTGIDATSMEGGGSEEELRHRGSEPSKRVIGSTAKQSKGKVWSWLQQIPGRDNLKKPKDDRAAALKGELLFMSGVVESIGVQSQLAPETFANPDPDHVVELEQFPFDQFQGGGFSRRRDSDPSITNGFVSRLKLRDENKRRPRSCSMVAFEATFEPSCDEPAQLAVADFQKEIAVRNIALFYKDPADVPDLPEPPLRPEALLPPPPPVGPPPPIQPRLRDVPVVLDEPPEGLPSEQGFDLVPPRDHPEDLPVAPYLVPEAPLPAIPDVQFTHTPSEPPLMPPPPLPARKPEGPPPGPSGRPPHPPPPPEGFPRGPPRGHRFSGLPPPGWRRDGRPKLARRPPPAPLPPLMAPPPEELTNDRAPVLPPPPGAPPEQSTVPRSPPPPPPSIASMLSSAQLQLPASALVDVPQREPTPLSELPVAPKDPSNEGQPVPVDLDQQASS